MQKTNTLSLTREMVTKDVALYLCREIELPPFNSFFSNPYRRMESCCLKKTRTSEPPLIGLELGDRSPSSNTSQEIDVRIRSSNVAGMLRSKTKLTLALENGGGKGAVFMMWILDSSEFVIPLYVSFHSFACAVSIWKLAMEVFLFFSPSLLLLPPSSEHTHGHIEHSLKILVSGGNQPRKQSIR